LCDWSALDGGKWIERDCRYREKCIFKGFDRHGPGAANRLQERAGGRSRAGPPDGIAHSPPGPVPRRRRLVSGGREVRTFGPWIVIRGKGLQTEGVLSQGDHIQGKRGLPKRLLAEVLRLQPGAEPAIANFARVLPEIGWESALDPQVVQLQLDGDDIFGEIAPDVVNAHIQPNHVAALALCFNYHMHLLFDKGQDSTEMQGQGELQELTEPKALDPNLKNRQ